MPRFVNDESFRLEFEQAFGFFTGNAVVGQEQERPKPDFEGKVRFQKIHSRGNNADLKLSDMYKHRGAASLEEMGLRGVLHWLSKIFRVQEKAMEVLSVVPFEDGPLLIIRNSSLKTQAFTSAAKESYLRKDYLNPFTRLFNKFEATASVVEEDAKVPDNYKLATNRYRINSMMSPGAEFSDC
jgi:hypothetical protein